MKKYLCLLMMACLSMMAFTSCSKRENYDDANIIVGKWRYDFGTDSFSVLTFNANGTGRYFEWDKGGVDSDDSIYYSYDPDNCILAWGRSKNDLDEVSIIVWNGRNEFYATWDSGSTWVRQR